jgi:hypothetical protein
MFHYQRNAKMVRMGFITHCVFRKQFSFFSRDGIRNMAKKNHWIGIIVENEDRSNT